MASIHCPASPLVFCSSNTVVDSISFVMMIVPGSGGVKQIDISLRRIKNEIVDCEVVDDVATKKVITENRKDTGQKKKKCVKIPFSLVCGYRRGSYYAVLCPPARSLQRLM